MSGTAQRKERIQYLRDNAHFVGWLPLVNPRTGGVTTSGQKYYFDRDRVEMGHTFNEDGLALVVIESRVWDQMITDRYHIEPNKMRVEPQPFDDCCHKSRVNDLTHGNGPYRNYICLSCRAHEWKGIRYTRKEWDDHLEVAS